MLRAVHVADTCKACTNCGSLLGVAWMAFRKFAMQVFVIAEPA